MVACRRRSRRLVVVVVVTVEGGEVCYGSGGMDGGEGRK